MFELPQPRFAKRSIAVLASFVVHVLIVFLWAHREPTFVQPSSVAWGLHGAFNAVVYLPPRLDAADEHPKLQFHRQLKPALMPAPAPAESSRAGSQNGSAFSGLPSGLDATPAIPLAFPDPEIYPWQLAGAQGDVVVEVTIDQKGNVSDARVLQSLKRDIDEKCIATLWNWRFRPAMLDGVAIASRQDVHFHFPS